MGILARRAHNPSPATRYQTLGATAADVAANNLAITFTVPTSGRVLTVQSGYTWSNVAADTTFWNLREGAADVFADHYMHNTVDRTRHTLTRLISGLTAGTVKTYKWGAHCDGATETTNIECGTDIGPALMEVWDAPTSDLLAFVQYEPDPATVYSHSGTGSVADVDATNLAVTFTVPASGRVAVELEGLALNRQQWRVREGAANVVPDPGDFGRQVVSESSRVRVNIKMHFSGLTPSQVKTWKWGWEQIEASTAQLHAGTGWGALAMRVWNVTT